MSLPAAELPATGMASMMIPTFCRRPIVGHVYPTAGTYVVSLKVVNALGTSVHTLTP